MKAPKKLDHKQRLVKIAKIYGMKKKIAGRYKETPTNKKYISALYRKLGDIVNNPQDYKSIAITNSTKRLNYPTIAGRKFIPFNGFDQLKIVRGKVVRAKVNRFESGTVYRNYTEIFGPGDSAIDKLQAMHNNGRRFKSHLYGQLFGKRRFLISKIYDSDDNLLDAIHYLKEWQLRGNDYDKPYLLSQMYVLTQKVVYDK
jgi:hypothetical protein